MFNLDNEVAGCDPNMLRDINREFELAAEVVEQDEMQFNRELEWSSCREYDVSFQMAFQQLNY